MIRTRNRARNGLAIPSMPSSICGWLDATDALSYSGTGQTIDSLIATPADGTTQANNQATLGATSGSSTDDPTFVGTAGTSAAKFTLDGGDQFKLDAATLTSASVLLNCHRTDAAYPCSIAWVGYVPTYSAATVACFGNHSSSTQVGVSLVLSTDGSLRFVVRGVSATTALIHGLPRDTPVCIIVAFNSSLTTDNLKVWVNRRYAGTFSYTAPASSAASTRSMYICGANAAQQLPNGSQFKTFAWFNEMFDDAKANRVMDVLERRHAVSYRNQMPVLLTQGDSNTYYGAYNKLGTANDYAFNAEGQLSYTLAKLGHPAKYPIGNNIAVVGDTTVQMRTRFETDMSKKYGTHLFLLAGGNDVVQKLDPVTITQANLAWHIDKAINKYGYDRVYLCTQQPRGAWGSLTAPEIVQARLDVKANRDWALAQDGTYGGRVRVADFYDAMEDGTDTATAAVHTTVDGVHRSPYGAYLCGEKLRVEVAKDTGSRAYPDFSTNNLLTNGTLTGTGGSTAGGASGDVPDSFTLTLSGGSGGSPTLVGSKPSSTVAQFALDCGAGASDTVSATLVQSISSGFAVGDTVYGVAIVQVDTPTPVAIFEAALKLTLTGTGVTGVTNVTGMGAYDPTASNSIYIAETYVPVGEYMVQTPDIRIEAGTGLALEWKYQASGNTASGGAASGTFQIKGAGIFKTNT